MATPGVYMAQAQPVESGPQSLTTQAITGSERTSEQEVEWLQRLEAMAPARALYMRWWLTNSLAPLPPPQAGQGAPAASSLHPEWLEAAAQAGDLQARIEWGLLQASLLKWSEAVRWFDLASASSSTAKFNAQRIRQQLQHQGDAKRLSSDINQAEPEVIYRQARRYHQGDGIPANYAQALML